MAVAALLAYLWLPYLVGWLSQGATHLFRPALWTPQDLSVYAMAMDQGAAGSWRVVNRLTPEPHPPAFIYPIYVLTGRLLPGTPRDVALQLLWLLARLAFLGSLLLLVRSLRMAGAAWRVMAFVVLAGGASLLSFPLQALRGRFEKGLLPEWTWVEYSSYLTLISYPHLALTVAGMLFSLVLLLAVLAGRGRSWPLACSSLLVGLSSPQSLPALGVAVLSSSLLAPQLGWSSRRLGPPLAFGLGALPVGLYYLLIMGRPGYWQSSYWEANVLPSLSPVGLLIGLGPLCLGAAVSIRQRAFTSPAWRTLLLWAVVFLMLGYLPVPWQRRLSLGLHPFLALLAFPALGTSSLRTALGWMRVLVLASSVALSTLLLWEVASPARARPYLFADRGLLEVAQWLRPRVRPDEVVLSAELTGNLIAPHIRGRTYLAHPHATLHFPQKERALRQALEGGPEALQALSRSQGIHYLVVGPPERSLGAYRLEDDPLASPVFQAGSWTVYRLRSGEGQ